MKHCMLLFALLIVVTGLVAEGEFLWQENGLPVVVRNDIDWDRSIVNHPDGGSLILWTERKENNHDLYAMHIDSDGQNLWNEPRRIFNDKESMINAKVVESSDGNLFISWLTHDQYETRALSVCKFDWEGNPLWNQAVDLSEIEWDGQNQEMIADLNGGVYCFWNLGCEEYIALLSSSGEQVWQQTAFSETSNSGYSNAITGDGAGGIIVGDHTYKGSEIGYYLLVQRILPDGTTPWGDDGYIEFPGYQCNQFCRYDDNGIAVVFGGYGTNNDLYLQCIDMDGELLTDVPILLSEDISYSTVADITHDQNGNIYVGWSLFQGNTTGLCMQRINPDCQPGWESLFVFTDGINRSDDIEVEVDQNGDVYCSSMSNSCTSMNLLKLSSDGQLIWDRGVFTEENHYELYVDMVMDVDEDDVSLFWHDNRSGHETIYQQNYSSNGVAQLEEGGYAIQEGWDCSADYLSIADSEQNPSENLFFTRIQSNTNRAYFQSFDIDGNSMTPMQGIEFASDMGYHDAIIAVNSIGDNYSIVWLQTVDDICYLYANLFDGAGNQQWQDNLVVRTFDLNTGYCPSEACADLTDDGLLILWEEYSYNSFYDIMGQRIVDGQLAWQEPVTIYQNAYLDEMEIFRNYALVITNGVLRVLKIDEDGSPCEGWSATGTIVSFLDYFCRFNCELSSEGLLLGWLERVDDHYELKVHIIHDDGSEKWDDPQTIIAEIAGSYPEITVIDDSMIAVYTYGGSVLAQAFDLDCNPLWEEPALLDPDDGIIADMVATQDGALVVYYRQDYYDEYHSEVLLQHVSKNGEAMDEPDIVCSGSGSRYYADIVPSTDGKYFIVWGDNRDPVSRCTYAQAYQLEIITATDQEHVSQLGPSLYIYPNPFNPETTVRFSLSADSKVDLKVFNVKGQLVRTLCDEALPVGNHEITWDGTDNAKKSVSSGVYLIDLNIDGKDYRSKALLLK